MPRLLDIIMFVTTALACIGVDFVVMKFDRQETGLTLAAYIEQRQTDVYEYFNPPKLIDLLPSQIAGWHVVKAQVDTPVTTANGAGARQKNALTLLSTITQIHRQVQPDAEIIQMALSRGDVHLHLVAFLDPPGARASDSLPQTLSNGEVILARFLNASTYMLAPMATVRGIPLVELPINTLLNDPALRLLRADISIGLTLYLVTNSPQDPAIIQALEQFDMHRIQRFFPDSRAASAPSQPEAPAAAPQTAPVPAPAPAAQTEPSPAPAAPTGAATEGTPQQAQAQTEPPKPAKPCVRKAGVLVCPEE